VFFVAFVVKTLAGNEELARKPAYCVSDFTLVQ
jgi:hypothetical protein